MPDREGLIFQASGLTGQSNRENDSDQNNNSKVLDRVITFEYNSKKGEIWELRPLRDRIFFVAWHDGSFVLLHSFVKKTQKTPAREIAQAKRELADLIERGVEYERK